MLMRQKRGDGGENVIGKFMSVLDWSQSKIFPVLIYFGQIADDIMSVSRSLAILSKDLVISETKTGCLAMFTLDFDNNQSSSDLRYITQVTTLPTCYAADARFAIRLLILNFN